MGESCSWSLEIRMSCSYGLALMRAWPCDPDPGVSPGITQQILGIYGDLPGLFLPTLGVGPAKNHRWKSSSWNLWKFTHDKKKAIEESLREKSIQSIPGDHDHDHPGEVMEKEPPESFPENHRWDDGGKKWCPKERTIATHRKQFSNFENVFVFGINTIFGGHVILTISRFVCGTNFKRYPNNWVF